MFCFFFKPFGLQNYTFFLKYESFFEKKFVLQDFFCIFAPKMKKNEQFYRYLYAWYAENRRVLPWRETTDPYCIWVSEIILQQTRVQQGIDYYLRFIDRFPTVDDLARATEDEVLRMWQGLGYYSRARNLHKGARYITEERKHLQSPEWFPADYDELRRIPGVGDYTAGAIASFAYNLPYPAPDGNVYRVLARLNDDETPFDTTEGKKRFRKQDCDLLDQTQPRLFNSALMELGALVCTHPTPDCEVCPVSDYCLGLKHNTAALLPVRKSRPAVRDRYFCYTIYLNGDKTLIRQRTEKDIWHHLWEFPLEEVEAFPERETPLLGEFTHQLSHQRIHARFYIEKVPELPPVPLTYAVKLSELDDYALSRLTLKALDLISESVSRVLF